jgi:hypothetical protein
MIPSDAQTFKVKSFWQFNVDYLLQMVDQFKQNVTRIHFFL